MIARVWRGWTVPEKADQYQRLLTTEILPLIEARGVVGYRGAEVYRRTFGSEVEFVTTLRFDSWQAVREFAGEHFDVAVVPPQAQALLARFDERSTHYEVVGERIS